MQTKKKWYVKERHNPQLGIYFVACGQMSKTEAKKHEESLYGANYMLPFDSKKEYLRFLISKGAKS